MKVAPVKGTSMIDTVVLTLGSDIFSITDLDAFTPSAHWALPNAARVQPGTQSKQNPTKKELLAGIYKPRLTLARRINLHGRSEIMLKIELSLPKLFFGNNFDELRLKDFKPLMQKLVTALESMGVRVTAADLAQADVLAVHYSKNILLKDGSTPYHYINKIREANIKLSLDTNQTDYRNEGHSYKWHCNSYEVVFYDKIRDLEKAKKSEKRALEKDSALQLNLFDMLQKRKKLEILRMEVRLNKRQKIKQLLQALKIKPILTLQGLFKGAISKKVLLHYLDELERKRSPLLDYRATDKGLLTALIFNNPDLGPKQILQLYGLKKALEVVDARELRVMFAKYNARSWYRLMADANKVKLPMKNSSFSEIRKHLIKFKPLRYNSWL